ncbi:MAG: peptidoglycan-associated lipoprotein Pal [Terriglobales bacterium]|jgi:peptidoglycan-associated lipoprotein
MKMTITMTRWGTLVFTLGTIMFLGACAKKVAPPPPPPPPAPTAPTASLSANPNTIDQGQSTTLTWQTTNATDVSIDGIGAVDTSGSRQVTPSDSTTYHLIAKGAGGTQDATARVTVNAAPAPPPSTAPSATEAELFALNVKDIYFDYDKYDVRADQQGSLQGDAQFLQQHANIHITIEGHCDERGSTEYNLALGTNRADTVKNALIQAGVSGDRIKTFSYGKEKPSCTESNESCWQQNRRGHFVYEK